MNLREKLINLGHLVDVALFKFTAGSNRIAEHFIPLSDVRLNVLSCDNGDIVFSSAAPLVLQTKGRFQLQFRDRDVMTTVEGPRKGVNILPAMLHNNETAVNAHYCGYKTIVDDKVPPWLEKKILSIGTSPVFPVAQFETPPIFRISKTPETLIPVFSKTLLRDIGASAEDGTEEILSKFRNHIDMFGRWTEAGFLVSADIVHRGGCCVVAATSFSKRSGSPVYQMPLRRFAEYADMKKWQVELAGKEKHDLAREIDGAVTRQADPVVACDHRT